MASKKLSTTAGRFDVQMAQCVVINQIDKEILNYRVFPADTPDDFPSVGDVGCIYKAAKEAKLYQWDEDSQNYKPLNETSISIDTLQNSVADLEADVENLQNKIDGTGEGSIDAMVDEKIKNFMENASDFVLDGGNANNK